MDGPPNILLIVSDEERRNDWLEGRASLPNHGRLRAAGTSFERHYTHSSPCSPSRASLWTGRYLPQHGVVDNVSFPGHTPLDPTIATVGSLLRAHGYESAYLGKWHLEPGESPDLAQHGYSGWKGNDRHYVGGAWTQHHFDPLIAEQAVDWLRDDRPTDRPWFLTVSLLGPHDIMWYPLDQPDYLAAHPEEAEVLRFIQESWLGVELDAIDGTYPERFDRLPDNFHDDLHSKPEIQRMWRHVRNTEHFVGAIDPDDQRAWLRQLDYYAWLHEVVDRHVGTVLDGLDASGMTDDTIVIYTSDHGDACGAHGLRAKLPCVYEEVMGVPLVVSGPGIPTGATTQALSTHVDLAATIASLGGVAVDRTPTLVGTDLTDALIDPAAPGRDVLLFAQDSAQSPLLRGCRYAVRGFFDGTTKYARYYGIGGGVERDGTIAEGGKVFDVDAAFDDHDHEWYELDEDPGELVNLAHDRARRGRLREQHERLLELEAVEFASIVAD